MRTFVMFLRYDNAPSHSDIFQVEDSDSDVEILEETQSTHMNFQAVDAAWQLRKCQQLGLQIRQRHTTSNLSSSLGEEVKRIT